jgi:tetratricopeptide (TPR) repeat protein
MNTQKELESKIFNFIEKSPKAIWPRVIMARRLIIKNNSEEAVSLLEKLNELETLPNFYFITLSDALLASNNSEKLDEMYSEWQGAQRSNSAAYLNYIDILDKNKNYKLALKVTQKAIAQEKLENHYQLLSLEAYFLLATNQVELANKKANRLSSIEPNNAFLLKVQGQIALAQADFPAAIDFLSRSLELNKKASTGLFLATALRNNGQLKESIKLLENELKTFPDNQPFIRFLAELYVTASPMDAINSYEKILKKNPNDIVALNNISWTYLEQDNVKQALFYSRKAKDLAPKHPQILDTYGLILTKSNRLPEALEVLTLANKLSPQDTDIIGHLADAYIANNQLEKAEKLLRDNNLDIKK